MVRRRSCTATSRNGRSDGTDLPWSLLLGAAVPGTIDELRGAEDILLDGTTILNMIQPIGREDALERRRHHGLGVVDLERAPEGRLYTCRHWDTSTRRCRVYAHRPRMCRDYPYGKPCAHCGLTMGIDPLDRAEGTRMPLGTFLRDDPPTQLRGLQWLAFDDVAVIQSRTATSDSGGGASFVWNNVGTVPCRIYPVTLRGKGALVGEQINERTTHFCSMPAETQIGTADRILIANRGTFEVTVALETTAALTTRVETFQIS